MTDRRTRLQVLALALLAALLGALSSPAGAAEPAAAPPAAAPPNMESYQLVLLRRGPKWTKEPPPDAAKIQEQHIAHLTKMGELGHIVIAGPFDDQEDETLRGMCLYRVGTVEEARKLAEQDPAVVAGRLRVEVLTWWVEKGYMTFPKAPPAARP